MRGLRSAFLLALPVAITVACGSTTKTQGEILLSVQTDLSLPKDIDSLGLLVYSGGTAQINAEYALGEASQQLPATIGIIQGSSASESVRIRLTGRKNGALVLLSEVITTVPPGRIALLRMPLQWLCLGQANEGTDGSSPPSSLDGSATSKCSAAEQVCIAGTCADENVDSSKLPDYDPTQVFGGASAPGGDGTCLDTLGCFSSGFVTSVDPSNCTIPKPTGGSGINVALELPPASAGICGSEACLVPLDEASDVGWTDLNDGTLQLPTGVCTELAAKAFLGVAVTTSCAIKTPATPACGSWDSASESLGTADAGAPDGTPLGASEDAGNTQASDASSGAADSGANGADAGQDGGTVSCAAFTVSQAACDAVTQTGCAANQACVASAASAATSCAATGAIALGGACTGPTACSPGLYCLQNVCMPYCCSSADCSKGDGGLVQCSQQAAASNTFFGVCESF